MDRKPDFDNILCVLKRTAPTRDTLFEFFLNNEIYAHLAGEPIPENDAFAADIVRVKAFAAAGYDYVTIPGGFAFPYAKPQFKETQSLNDAALITNRAEFESYPWPDPDKTDYSIFERMAPHLPGNMKIMQNGPNGVLENVIRLVGYDNLCMMLYDDPELAQDIFDAVGSRLVRYYERGMEYDSVGVLMSNDDWGFNTQTMISPADMEKYVFPWHQKFVSLAHGVGIPAVLHSCGNFDEIMDYTIGTLKYDGKHSYEDNILPVEDAYRKWGGRIAILGGIDMHFVATKTPEEITARCKAMLDLGKTGYALGTGNSIPEYIPWENFFAMTEAVFI
jgi:uroporphyrinogen decarboxylase